MPSFKPHAVAGVIFALPFVPGLLYLCFGLLGASIPDLDLDVNKHKVYSMVVAGVVLSVVFFMLNLDVLPCVLLLCLAVVLYFSKHRGFTHTFAGIVFLSFLFMLMFMGFLSDLIRLNMMFNLSVPTGSFVFIILAFFGYFIVRRRYLLFYLVMLAVLVLLPGDVGSVDALWIFLILFVGCFSHLVLDLNTPAGVSVLNPLVKTRFHKAMGLFLFIVWICTAGYYLYCFHPLFQWA